MEERIDGIIRLFLYILIFWVPYSPAVIESCFITCFILWLVKRGLFFQKSAVNRSRQLSLAGNISESFSPVSNNLNKPIGFFLLACLVSVVGSLFFLRSLHGFFTKTLEWFFVYFLILEVFHRRRHFIIFLIILCVTSTATVFDSFYQYYISGRDIFRGFPIAEGGRATAGFHTPVGLGAYLNVLVPIELAMILLFGKNIRWQIFLIPLLLATLWSLYLTGTRAAWLGCGFGVGLILLAYMFIKMKWTFKFRHFIVILAILMASLASFWQVSHTKTKNFRMNTIEWRLEIWQDTLEMIKDRPLFGHGLNTYMLLFQEYRGKVSEGFEQAPTYAHNSYLQLAAETGGMGLLLFLWIIYAFLKNSFKDLHKRFMINKQWLLIQCGIACGVAGYFVHSFFDTNFYSLQLSVYLWVMVGTAVALSQMTVNDQTEERLF